MPPPRGKVRSWGRLVEEGVGEGAERSLARVESSLAHRNRICIYTTPFAAPKINLQTTSVRMNCSSVAQMRLCVRTSQTS